MKTPSRKKILYKKIAYTAHIYTLHTTRLNFISLCPCQPMIHSQGVSALLFSMFYHIGISRLPNILDSNSTGGPKTVKYITPFIGVFFTPGAHFRANFPITPFISIVGGGPHLETGVAFCFQDPPSQAKLLPERDG